MRRALVLAAGLAVLAGVNWTIAARETLLRDGRVVLLELAPVDPRSLLQGDYMALRFQVAGEAFPRIPAGAVRDGHLVVHVDADGVGTFRRLDDGTPVAADEVLLRYRWRGGVPRLATNAYFFEEGRGRQFSEARYGEFRVAPGGEAILAGLRDQARAPLGPRAP